MSADRAIGSPASFPRAHLGDNIRYYSDSPVRPEDKPLSLRELVCKMNTIKSDIAGCFTRHRNRGTVMVNVNVAPRGQVTANATGPFAGMPTATCVENAVKTLSFPPSKGLTTSYPSTLR